MVQKALQHLFWCCLCIVVFIVAITMGVHDSSSLSSTNAVIPLVVDFLRYRRPSNDIEFKSTYRSTCLHKHGVHVTFYTPTAIQARESAVYTTR